MDAVIHKQLPKGKVEDVRVKRSPEQMKQLQDLAAAAIGFDATRGDVLTLEDLSFQQPVIAVMPPPTVADKVRKGLKRLCGGGSLRFAAGAVSAGRIGSWSGRCRSGR